MKREIDEEGYDWDAGVPHYDHIHYTHDGDIDFSPRIIGGMPSFQGEFPAQVSERSREMLMRLVIFAYLLCVRVH